MTRLFNRRSCVNNIAQATMHLLFQTRTKQFTHARRQGRVQPPQVGLSITHGGERVDHRFPRERSCTTDELVQHATQRPNIRSLVDAPSSGLFWAHVRRRANDHASFSGNAIIGRVRPSLLDLLGDRGGDAEVQQFDNFI
jgi:hypothetical protein